IADSPTTGPSAKTRPTVPGAGASGSSSRTPNTVVVASNPGSDATLTATINNCAHSLVESGQRPEITNPFRAPREWKGATSMARPEPVSISPSVRVFSDTPMGRSAQHAAARQRLQADTGNQRRRSRKKHSRNSVRGATRVARRPEAKACDQAEINPLACEVAAA